MKIILNPVNGADIKDVFNQVIYRHPKNTYLRYEDDQIANALLKKFEFLEDVTGDTKLKIDKIEEPETEEWIDHEDFGPDKRQRRKDRLEQETEPDMAKDPEAYYGKGLTEDNTNGD